MLERQPKTSFRNAKQVNNTFWRIHQGWCKISLCPKVPGNEQGSGFIRTWIGGCGMERLEQEEEWELHTEKWMHLSWRECCPVIEKCLILIDKKMGLGKKQHRRRDMLWLRAFDTGLMRRWICLQGRGFAGMVLRKLQGRVDGNLQRSIFSGNRKWDRFCFY